MAKAKTSVDDTGAVTSGPEPGDPTPEASADFDSGPASMVPHESAGIMAAVAREGKEIEAAIIQAKKWPRDEKKAGGKIIRSCHRLAFAMGAVYNFPRAGQKIEGPSVQLAREMARCWTNIRYGVKVVTEDEDRMHIKGWCLDAETNTYVEAEDKFKKLIYRKKGGWQKPDERDLRELMNRRGAILVRNCILQVLPPDISAEAVAASKITVQKGVADEDPEKAARALIAAFMQQGVTAEMLEKHLGHDLSFIEPKEMEELRGIFTSIREGNTSRKDHFDVEVAKEGPEEGTVDTGKVTGTAEEKPPESRGENMFAK